MKEVNKEMKIGEALTWDELADIYDRITGGHARTLEMDQVFEWFKAQKHKFFVSKDDTIHMII